MAEYRTAGEPQLGRVALDNTKQREAESCARVRIGAFPDGARCRRAAAAVHAKAGALNALAGEEETVGGCATSASPRATTSSADRDRDLEDTQPAVDAGEGRLSLSAAPSPPVRRTRCASRAARRDRVRTASRRRTPMRERRSRRRARSGEAPPPAAGEDAAMQGDVVARDEVEGIHRGRCDVASDDRRCSLPLMTRRRGGHRAPARVRPDAHQASRMWAAARSSRWCRPARPSAAGGRGRSTSPLRPAGGRYASTSSVTRSPTCGSRVAQPLTLRKHALQSDRARAPRDASCARGAAGRSPPTRPASRARRRPPPLATLAAQLPRHVDGVGADSASSSRTTRART